MSSTTTAKQRAAFHASNTASTSNDGVFQGLFAARRRRARSILSAPSAAAAGVDDRRREIEDERRSSISHPSAASSSSSSNNSSRGGEDHRHSQQPTNNEATSLGDKCGMAEGREEDARPTTTTTRRALDKYLGMHQSQQQQQRTHNDKQVQQQLLNASNNNNSNNNNGSGKSSSTKKMLLLQKTTTKKTVDSFTTTTATPLSRTGSSSASKSKSSSDDDDDDGIIHDEKMMAKDVVIGVLRRPPPPSSTATTNNDIPAVARSSSSSSSPMLLPPPPPIVAKKLSCNNNENNDGSSSSSMGGVVAKPMAAMGLKARMEALLISSSSSIITSSSSTSTSYNNASSYAISDAISDDTLLFTEKEMREGEEEKCIGGIGGGGLIRIMDNYKEEVVVVPLTTTTTVEMTSNVIGLKERMEALLISTATTEATTTIEATAETNVTRNGMTTNDIMAPRLTNDNSSSCRDMKGGDVLEEVRYDDNDDEEQQQRQQQSNVVDDDVKFRAFINGLCREVSGDHTELWSSFQSLCGREVQVPLCTNNDDNASNNGVNDESTMTNNTTKKKSKRIKMDNQTQETLTIIHRNLMSNERIKGRFMTSNCQLVNDKRYYKEIGRSSRKQRPNEELSSSSSTTTMRKDETTATSIVVVTSSTKGKLGRSEIISSPLPTPTNVGGGSNSPTNISPFGTVKLRHVNRDSPRKKSRTSSTSLSLSPLMISTDTTDPTKEGGVGVVVVPSWSNVHYLRTTPKSTPTTSPINTTTASSNHVLSRTATIATNNGHATTLASSSSSVSNASLFNVGDIINLDTLLNENKTDVSSNSVKDDDYGDDEVMIFPLESSKNSISEEEEIIDNTFVIVRRLVLFTVNTSAAVTTTTINVGSKRIARVTWSCLRSEIRSLTLNVEATGVDVSHVHGQTSLLFNSANVCLDFAQAFYNCRGGTTAITTTTANFTSPITTSLVATKEKGYGGADDKKKSIHETEMRTVNVVSNDLAEDEKRLLDRYRQFSQSDRTKLRLTCLSPQGGMQVMEVALSPPTTTSIITNSSIVDADNNTTSTAVKNVVGEIHQPTLSYEDEITASKYRKMLSMGILPDAVRHKMTSDDIAPIIMATVLDEITNANNVNDDKHLTDDEETIAAKYRSMMKMGVPIDGVRHKMAIEGVSSNIVKSVCDDITPLPRAAGGATQLTSDEEIIASKYRKMLKVGIPLDDVKHKMGLDGIDLKIVSVIAGDATQLSDSRVDESDTAPDLPTKNTNALCPTLSKDEEAIATKYRNMLKVCIPKDAIRHKMKQEGVIDKIMDAVIGKEVDISGSSSSSIGLLDQQSLVQATNNKKTKTIAFHWTTSNLAPELLEKSIFGRTELKKKRKLISTNPEELDIKKLEEVFQKKHNNATTKKMTVGQEDTNDMAKLLDLTRANNVAISLKAFNDFTFRSLAETINDIDPDYKIDSERVQFIPNLLPSANEIQSIKKYSGDDDRLITAELFFRHLVPIKRIEDKVKVMRAMSTFDENVKEARAGFTALQVVCGQIMDSEKLIQVLEMVLNIGNLMNAGTLDGGVEAFKFESLPKLSQTKSADGKTTILDYIVESFIEKGDRETLLLMSEFPTIQDSCRLSIGDLMNNLTLLRNDYKLCKSELTSMKRDQSSKRLTRSMSKKIEDEISINDHPRGALFAEIKSRSSKYEDDDPRNALFAAIKNKQIPQSADIDEESPTYTPGVHRLQIFLNESKSTLALAEKDQDAAIRACKVCTVLSVVVSPPVFYTH